MKNNVNEGRNTRARRQKPDGFVLILCYRLHSIQTLAQVANISTFSRSRCPHLLCLDAQLSASPNLSVCLPPENTKDVRWLSDLEAKTPSAV